MHVTELVVANGAASTSELFVRDLAAPAEAVAVFCSNGVDKTNLHDVEAEQHRNPARPSSRLPGCLPHLLAGTRVR